MKFSIGPQFSREFPNEDRLIVDDLTDTLNGCISEKKYNSEIEKIYIAVLCVSKGFEPFFKARPLKILRNEPAIEYEIKLEFETFFKANKEEKITILNNEFLNQSKEILSDKKVKKFDTDAFINDIKECLNKN
ncbi:MAG: hypothetical protein ABIP27_16920 [Flavobacterium circumlabens]|uniref:hypothetical protein n=1 Tax=Flavobacterium circumlabens TaxID=2133765 RepID=UPI003266DE84